MNNEPSYFGLTNDHTWLSVDEGYYKKLKPTHRMKCYTTPQTKPLSLADIEDFINAYGLDMGDTYEFTLAQATRMIVEIEHHIRGGK
jgi:hypothetical protein